MVYPRRAFCFSPQNSKLRRACEFRRMGIVHQVGYFISNIA
jgi:hypothetical protein